MGARSSTLMTKRIVHSAAWPCYNHRTKGTNTHKSARKINSCRNEDSG